MPLAIHPAGIRLDAVKQLSPAYFALVMATGIVSVGAWDFGLGALAIGLLAFNVVAYGAIAALTILRAVRYPLLFVSDMTSHRQAPGFFTAVAGSCILGVQVLLIAKSLAAATVFLALGVVLWIALTYTVFTAFTVRREKPSLEQGLTGAWLIAVVATQSVAVLAALVARGWPQPLRLELNFFALSMWLWGGMFYIWIISLIFYRYSFFAFSPGDLTPPYWINMGAMAISALAGARLVENTPDAPFLASLLPFLKGITVLYWATGTWWIPMLLVLGVWRHIARRFPLRYDPLYWGAVFPLGMYGVATHEMTRALDLPLLDPLPLAMFVAALVAWTLAFVGLLQDLRKRAASANRADGDGSKATEAEREHPQGR
ncbi:tellurite resistance/C4-dicarboxylate transporter family protein [Enhydrobacter sp.]|uniref:tellurite resistance/C4-dicarboxylate transporter family protein n=1 Tax=Enhydrobacter sp. TaxID=1894999 RepID=UPI00260A7CD6|nr:tellurite resistance/C4-dicarboxylate transporter family protein [Enhydrobacter sp.]WIM14112.1 MAG: C4-dicarboxylate transporter/malic acid transport protein [Enhydrobacter sp.]